MKKILFALVLTLTAGNLFAQDEVAKDSIKDGWKRGGNVLVTFNQSAFNNEWSAGGIGNIAANILVNYDFNYTKGNLIWDNKLIADYGVNKNDGQDDFTKNNDRLEFNSLAGKQIMNNWYYSFYFNMKTQMDASNITTITQDDPSTPLINEYNVSRNTTSHFFSPVYFQAGPGLLWKKSDNFHVNISPAAGKLIIVHKEFAGAFGTEAGDTERFELGTAVRGYYKVNLMKNISMENILALYSNYLEDAQNVDVDYTMNLAMKVNKYISANLTFQAIYDDNTQRNGFQIRETFGLGFNYAF